MATSSTGAQNSDGPGDARFERVHWVSDWIDEVCIIDIMKELTSEAILPRAVLTADCQKVMRAVLLQQSIAHIPVLMEGNDSWTIVSLTADKIRVTDKRGLCFAQRCDDPGHAIGSALAWATLNMKLLRRDGLQESTGLNALEVLSNWAHETSSNFRNRQARDAEVARIFHAYLGIETESIAQAKFLSLIHI